MRFSQTFVGLLISLSLVATSASAGPHAHTHGVGELELALDGSTVRASLRLPMESLLGFEHAPRTEAQKEAVQKLKARLADPVAWILPSSQAGCRLVSTDYKSTLFSGEVVRGHSDLEYIFAFECRNVTELTRFDVLALQVFPRLRSLRVQLVTDQGQRALQLTKKNPVVLVNSGSRP
jgi:hypothetical protein